MRKFVFLSVIFCLTGIKCWAAPVKVGAILGPPFVIVYDTTHSGISVEIWDAIARSLNQPYSFIDYTADKTQEAFEALSKGELDVIIGPLAVTYENLEKADFTLPYYVDKVIAVAVLDYVHNFLKLFDKMFFTVRWIIGVFFVTFVLYLVLLWYYERECSSTIPRGYREGLSYLFWKHILIGRHADDIPKSLQGKGLILFKAILFYIILTMLSATLISFLTISLSDWTDPIQSFSDLEKRRVGAIDKGHSFKLAKHLGLKVLPFESLKDGIQALEGGQIDAFLSDLSLADAYLRETGNTNVSISHYVLKYDIHAFAVPQNSPLLRKINQHMLALRKNEVFTRICKGYLDKGVKACAL